MIILLTCSDTIHIDVLRCLIKSGIKSIGLGTSETSDSALSRYCKKFYQVPQEFFDGFHDDVMIDFIKNISKKHNCQLIMPVCLHATCLLARIKSQLKSFINTFPVSTESTLKTLHNKWYFFLFLQKLKIAAPVTCLLNNIDELCLTNPKLQFPVIIKPLEDSGGKGVKVISNYTVLFEELRNRHFPLIIQEFIPGYDIDLSILSIRGKITAWTIQRRTDISIDFSQNKEVLNLGKKILEGSLFHGVAHFDLRIDEQTGIVKVIECNPRFWGSVFASCCVGVNFPVIGIKSIIRQRLDFEEASKNARFILRKKASNHISRLTWASIKQFFNYEILIILKDPVFNLYTLLKTSNIKKIDYLKSILTRKKVVILAAT